MSVLYIVLLIVSFILGALVVVAYCIDSGDWNIDTMTAGEKRTVIAGLSLMVLCWAWPVLLVAFMVWGGSYIVRLLLSLKDD